MRLRNRLICLAMLTLAELSTSTAGADEPKKKGEPDVVFDNTGSARRKQEEQQKEQEAKAGADDVDTPFADTAPDPAAMRAQRWQPGLGFGARLGYALPFGSSSGAKFSKQVNGMFFLWGDFGYWPIPYLFAGLYLSGGYVFPDCGQFDSCSGWDLRGGPEVIVRFLPFEKVTPWVGLGFGYEFLWAKYSQDPLSVKISERGLELLNLQAGVDVLSGGQFLGIFASFSLGKFSSGKIKTDVAGSGSEADIDNSDTHNWLAIGARGTFE